MIDATWLILLMPISSVIGFLVGSVEANRFYCMHICNARFALKRAEAYEAYKKAISND